MRRLTNDFNRLETLNRITGAEQTGAALAQNQPGAQMASPSGWVKQMFTEAATNVPGMSMAAIRKHVTNYLEKAASAYNWTPAQVAEARDAINSTYLAKAGNELIPTDAQGFLQSETQKANLALQLAQFDSIDRYRQMTGGAAMARSSGAGNKLMTIDTPQGKKTVTVAQWRAMNKPAKDETPAQWYARVNRERTVLRSYLLDNGQAESLAGKFIPSKTADPEILARLREVDQELVGGPPSRLEGGPRISGDSRAWDDYGGQGVQTFFNNMVGVVGRTEADRVLKESKDIVQLMLQQGAGEEPSKVYPTLKQILRMKYPSLANVAG